jgi:Fe2+ or Zn2+ uptake regulation protein
MIKKIWLKEYAVVCDKCGKEMLSDSDAQEAIKAAKKDGWEIQDRCFETPRAICPDCKAEAALNAKGGKGDD